MSEKEQSKLSLYTDAHLELWKYWISTRPQVIRDMVEKYKLNPFMIYWYRENEEGARRVTVQSLNEDGTIMIAISEFLNPESMIPMGGFLDRSVFGIDPQKLTPCYDSPVEPDVLDPIEDLDAEKLKIDQEEEDKK